jgi:NADPH:quinone reductase-like Zn-dependent oxidoreductase
MKAMVITRFGGPEVLVKVHATSMNPMDCSIRRGPWPGGAGGVGSLAIQLAKARGATVLATCRSRNCAFVKSLGADEAIDYTQGAGVDVVLDTAGKETLSRSIAVTKPFGRLVLYMRSPRRISVSNREGCEGRSCCKWKQTQTTAEQTGLVEP